MNPKDTLPEEWRDVPGYEGLYQASNLGRIKSLHRGGRILSPTLDHTGYEHISLSKGGVVITRNIHRLVALAFLGDPNGLLVRHLDGDSLNNRVTNLAWGTGSENNQDTLDHGRHAFATRTHCMRGHEYTPENTQLIRRERRCRICTRARQAQYREAKRGNRS